MSGWLLDTNVISELRKPKPDANVVAFVAGCPIERLYVSAVTFAEIRFGIERLAEIDRRAELNRWLDTELRPLFEGRVLPVSEDVMLTWRILVERGRKARHTFSQPDLIIAATAIRHGLALVTRDVSDHEKSGVALFDPWRDRSPDGGSLATSGMDAVD